MWVFYHNLASSLASLYDSLIIFFVVTLITATATLLPSYLENRRKTKVGN
jgi:hypothetical protein